MASINASYDKNSITFAKVYEMIMIKEIRRMKSSASRLGSAMKKDSIDKNKNCEDGQKGRSKSKNRRSKSNNPNNNNS